VIRFGPDGRSYYGSAHGITAAGADLKSAVIADGIAVRDFVVAHNGLIYATEAGNVWLVRPDGAKQVADSGLHSATGVTLSPDQSQLYVADGATHWIYSYQVQPDGTLADGQRYYWLHVADTEEASHAGGMSCDQAGRLYVATDLGVQVCDQAGRVNAILPLQAGRPTSVTFGGPKFDTLYATTAVATYRRRLNTTGANPWAEPTLPPAPKL
jgi:sugar lactone lactonase YvrE